MEAGTVQLELEHCGDREFLMRVRDHTLTVDLPPEAGGSDAGPTPTELFVASLAASAAICAEGFLRRNGLPDRVQVTGRWRAAVTPMRISNIGIRIVAPAVPAELRDALRRSVQRCTLNSTLQCCPEVEFELAEPPTSVASVLEAV